jgi:hypothetical protein
MKPETEKLIVAWLGAKWRTRLVVLAAIIILGIFIVGGLRSL